MGKKKEKRRAASYYIDFENVRGAGLDGVENLREGDRVTVLYGSRDSALKIDQVKHVMDSPAKVEFIQVATGKHDALDFQLVALLFMKMKKSRDYFIISKDTGFDFAIHMARAKGMERVFRRESISGATLEPKKLPGPRRRKPQKRLPQPRKQAPQNSADGQQARQQPQSQAVDRRQAGQENAAGSAPQGDTPLNDLPQSDAPQTDSPDSPRQSSRRRRRRSSGQRAHQRKDAYRLAVEKTLGQQLGELPPAKQLDAIVAALESCDTKTRFYNFLRKEFGNEEGRELYQNVKGCFEELRAIERPSASPKKPASSDSTNSDEAENTGMTPNSQA